MADYIPKYPSQEGDDSNKSSSELLAETLKPIYVPQDLMLAWESHLASYSRDTNVLLDQVKDSETALNTQYQVLLTRVQKYEQMLQDITMDSNEFTMDTDVVNFTGWNILAQASYWDYLLRKEITKLSDQIKSTEYKGVLVTEVTDAVLVGLIADNTYISNVIGALSDTPLIRELDAALTSTTTSLSDLQAEYVRLAEKQAADATALANQQVLNVEQLVADINTSTAAQLDRIAQEATVRTQLLQEIEVRTNGIEQEAFQRSEELSARLDVVTGEATQNVVAITDRINTEVAERNQMIADQAQALLFESEARAADISTQAAAILAETLAREEGLASQANALSITDSKVTSIEGTITAQGSSITALQSGLNTAQTTATDAANLAATKADATALTTLDTKVTGIGNNVTNQGTAITNLTGELETTNTLVNTKASTASLTALETNVTAIDGKVINNVSAITSLSGKIDTVEAGLLTKAEATALNNYFTKVEAEQVIAGQVSSFSSGLVIGGVNQLINSENERNVGGSEYITYEISNYLYNFYERNLNKAVTVSFEINVPVAGPVAVYAANLSAHTLYGMVYVPTPNVWHKLEITCLVKQNTENTLHKISSLEFFGYKGTGRIPSVRRVQLEEGTKATTWSLSPRDTEAALLGLNQAVNANTTSINSTNTEVTRINGEVVTQGNSITQLQSNLVATDTKANTAINNAATAQQTANTGVSKAEAAASTANTLKATYEDKVILLDSEDAANKQAITKTSADLVSAQTTLANADTALGSRIDSLVTKVDSNEAAANSKIDSVTESVTTLSGATNTRFDSMESELTAVSTVATDAQYAAGNNSNAIGGLDSRIGTAETALLTKASASALDTTNTNLSNLEGTVTSQGTQLTTLNNNLVQTDTILDGVKGTADTALSEANTANGTLTTKADSSVVSALSSQVSGISGEVQSNSSSITALTNRVEDNEVAIGTKASSDALQSLTNEVSTVKGTVTTQGQSITDLSGTVTSQGTLIVDAQTAANNAASLAGSKGKVFFQNTAPPASERLAQNLWIDTTGGNNTPKRWQTNAWNPVSDKVATDALNAANQANTAITTKADVTALQDLQTNLTAVDGRVTSNASELTSLKANLAITNSVVDTKADTSALNSLITEVTNVDDKVTANTSSITSLGSTVTTITGELADKADAALLNDYFTKAEANEATSGQIAAFNANLIIGGVNQLFDSEAERGTDGSDYLSYERSKSLYNFYQANLGKPVTISFELNTPVTGILNVLSANLSAHSFIDMVYVTKADSWTKYEITTTPKLNNEYGLYGLMSSLEFKGVTPGLAPKVRKVQLEAGTRSTDWSPSPRDYTEAFNSLTSITEANAQAVDSITTQVSQIDGELVSVGESITTLTNSITQVDTEAKKGITNAATAQSTADTAVSANEVTAGRVDVLTTTMERMDGDIQTKATIVAVNGLETRIGQAEDSLTLQASDISSLQSEIGTKASSGALDALSTYVTEGVEGNLTTESNRITTLTGRVDTVVGDLAKKADASALSSLTSRVETEEGKSTSQGTAITSLQNTVNHATTGLSTKASSAALTAVDNKVTAVDGRVTATNSNVTSLTGRVSTVEDGVATKADVSAVNALTTRVGNVEGGLESASSSITTLESSIAGKADTSALSELTVRVLEEERKSTSQATDITSLTSKADAALDSVTIKDTRSTNEPPSWYLANYARRSVNEFKTQTVIGVGGFFGGTYCNLETKVYYTDLSGGDIIQTATSSVDPSLYVQRRSDGTAAWTAWAQPIKDLRDTIGTKASASAVSTLDTKVENIDGKVTTQASQILTLTSDNDTNKNALQVQATVIDGVKANYMVKMETNGVIGGFGLIQSTGALGQVSTSFGVNADSFFIGAPAGGKKPFMVTTANQVVDGITYPAGTWINSAIIANATIGTAHIADASITNAKIANIDAAKITTGTLDAARIRVGAGTQYDAGYDPSNYGWKIKTTDTDFNAMKTTGKWLVKGTRTNVPFNAWTYLIVDAADSTRIIQTAYADNNVAAAYQRTFRDSSWDAWVKTNITPEFENVTTVVSGQTLIEGGKIRTNSITANQISVADLSAISANLGTIKVGSANIADLAVNAAHIADAAITTAKIGDLQVDTLKVKDNAITVGVGVSGTNSITITTSGGTVRAEFNFTLQGTASNILNTSVSVSRGGTTIRSMLFPYTQRLYDSSGHEYYVFAHSGCSIVVVETIPAGTHTYAISGEFIGSIHATAMEFKK